MNYICIIEFFKELGLYDEEYFELIKNKTSIISGDPEKIKEFIGFYPKYENNQICDFKLYLPELKGLDNILIYIHEYTHALFPEDDNEIFPCLMEAMFLKEYLKHEKFINREILKIQDKLKEKLNKKYSTAYKYKIKYLQCKPN